MQLEEVLQKYFGYSHFRPGQKEIISTILSGNDVLGVLPTGGGKSVCYQLPALVMPGLTLVVSPLISLMKDQVDSLQQLGISAALINSTVSDTDFQAVIQQINQGVLKLLYVAPERLESSHFTQYLSRQDLSLIAIDEAHCVSQWGFDFRPSYRNIHDFIQQLPKRPVVSSFTATATKLVQEDILEQLALKTPKVFINSFDRPNINFSVIEPADRYRTLLELVNHDESIIVYANTRKQVDKLFDDLSRSKYKVGKYHAGMSAEERLLSQEAFINDEVNIIIATNAFGMGIDKTDVRKVIHYNLPKDLESYYQEAGRAGRDSLEAEAVLLYKAQDIMTNKYLIAQSNDQLAEERLETMIQYANFTGCLRNYTLRYFGENPQNACGNCSNCSGNILFDDVTKESQMILSCILRMNFSYGATMVIDVLKGSRNQKVLDKNFDQIKTYGIMSSYSTQQIRDIISALVAHRYLAVNEYRGLYVTESAKAVLTGQAAVKVKQRQYSRTTTNRTSKNIRQDVDQSLFEELRKLRAKLAKEEQMPAYIVFSNKSLEDMASMLPRTYEEFLLVEGVGTVKAEKYAGPFLAEIASYLNKEDQSVNYRSSQSMESSDFQNDESRASSASSSESYLTTIAYYNEGLSPFEIAIERGYTEGTIINHLTKAAIEGELEEFDSRDADVSDRIRRQILEVFSSIGSQPLKAVKKALPDEISYDEIKYVLIEYLVNQSVQ